MPTLQTTTTIEKIRRQGFATFKELVEVGYHTKVGYDIYTHDWNKWTFKNGSYYASHKYTECTFCGELTYSGITELREHTTQKGDVEVDVVTADYFCNENCKNDWYE